MKEHFLIKGGEMQYPIGTHIMNNIETINDMADSIYLVMSEYYDLPHIDNVIIFCRGSSGAIISGIVSAQLSKLLPERTNLIIHHVKKEGETSHASGFVDSAQFRRSITIIVDDFIATGRTIRSILEYIHDRRPDQIIDILCVSGSITDEFGPNEIRHGICSR